MTRAGCLLQIILALIVVPFLIWAATHSPPEALPGTLDPVLNHEAYP